jgi:hypothetical protein
VTDEEDPVPTPHLPLRQLRRVRWAVRGTLVLGVAASVAANVLHARPDPVAQIIAAWPPLALLLTVELISRVPVHRRLLAAARLAATTAIAGIAAWVSYWHMAGVALRYGEEGASPFLLPLSVDGLVIVASISLVELAGRIRAADVAHSTTTVGLIREPVVAVRPASGGKALQPATRGSADPGPGGGQPGPTRPDGAPIGHAGLTSARGTGAADKADRVDLEPASSPDAANSAGAMREVCPALRSMCGVCVRTPHRTRRRTVRRPSPARRSSTGALKIRR